MVVKMTRRRNVLGFILAMLIIHLLIFPPVHISDEYHDQFCLIRGCARQVRIYNNGRSIQESVIKTVPNCLSSYSTALLGPCPGHEWISYHGGGSRYMGGLAYYFAMEENFTFSGSNRELVSLGATYKFQFVEHIFRKLYRNNPEILKRILIYILSRYQKDRWVRFEDFVNLLTAPKQDLNALTEGLTELEKEP